MTETAMPQNPQNPQNPPNPMSTDVDFDADGVRHGHLKLPHSDNRSAWGAVMTPVTVVKNGDGATALLTGGNHGDEYEGPTALLDFAARIDPARVRGRIIIVPMMNHPAFLAGARTSPLDQLNMNRVFPGRADGGPTEKIADYFRRALLPMADYVLDIHSGGKTLQFVPFAAAYTCEDARLRERSEAAMRAFAAPYQVLMVETDTSGMYDGAALAQGKVFVTTELGGGGATCTRTLEIARAGVESFLRHAGILKQAPVQREGIALRMRGESGYIRSAHAGLLELLADPGERVSAGGALAKVYDIHRSGAMPAVYQAPLDGILLGRHYPGLVRHGDMIAVVAEEI